MKALGRSVSILVAHQRVTDYQDLLELLPHFAFARLGVRSFMNQTKKENPMKKKISLKHSRAAQTLLLLGLTVVAGLAQSGDISASTAPAITLGVTILKALLALALIGCVGTVIYGAVTLGGNRPRALAMIAGGVFGGLIAGLSYALIGTTSGATVPTSTILLSFIR